MLYVLYFMRYASYYVYSIKQKQYKVYIESMFYTSCVMLHTMFRLAMQMEIEKREEYRIVQVFSVTYTSRNRSGRSID